MTTPSVFVAVVFAFLLCQVITVDYIFHCAADFIGRYSNFYFLLKQIRLDQSLNTLLLTATNILYPGVLYRIQ